MDKLGLAINELVRLSGKNRRLRRKELVKALEALHDGLDELSEDQALLEKGDSVNTEAADESKVTEIVTNLRKFQDSFLTIENRELVAAKLGEDSRKKITRSLRDARKGSNFDSLVGGYKPLRDSINDTRSYVEKLLELLEQEDSDFKKKNTVQRSLKNLLGVASGIAVVTTNINLLPTDSNTAFTSTTLGSAIVGDCWSKVSFSTNVD
ncbi:MAG: hypothetical protein AAGA11_18810 [Pseudomonadota bacterium]